MTTIRNRISKAVLVSALALAGVGVSASGASAAVTTPIPYSYSRSTLGCNAYYGGYTIGYGANAVTLPHTCFFPEVTGVVPGNGSSRVYRYNRVWSWNFRTQKWDVVSTSPWAYVDCAEQGCLGVVGFGSWFGLSAPSFEAQKGQWVITETNLFFKELNTPWQQFVLWNEYDGNGAPVTGGSYKV
jgi:hypothetical protein